MHLTDLIVYLKHGRKSKENEPQETAGMRFLLYTSPFVEILSFINGISKEVTQLDLDEPTWQNSKDAKLKQTLNFILCLRFLS